MRDCTLSGDMDRLVLLLAAFLIQNSVLHFPSSVFILPVSLKENDPTTWRTGIE